MNRKLVGLVIGGFVFISGCRHIEQHLGTNSNSNSGATPTKPDEFAAARAVFGKECKSCHGDTGSGGPIKLKDGTTLKVPNLHEGHALRHPDSDFVKQITKGGDGMPAFGEKLKSDQINDLVRFIRHEFQGGATPPAEPAKSPMKEMKTKP
jgi:mono/diheme cytochrome c family protein